MSIPTVAGLDPATAVREARRRAGLTQGGLAGRAGTSQASISDIERGRRQPTVELLDRLLRECGRTLVVDDVKKPALDADDVMLLRLNRSLSPAERLAQMGRVVRLRALARR